MLEGRTQVSWAAASVALPSSATTARLKAIRLVGIPEIYRC
jgi:hypothetical protein